MRKCLIKMNNNIKIGFLGGGVMASALINGILKSGLLTSDRIIVSDPSNSSREKLAEKGVRTTENNVEVVRFADVIIIATKPDVVKPCLLNLQEYLSLDEFNEKSFISIAAGVSISSLEEYLPIQTKSVIRVMPNTPCLVGQSAAAFSPGSKSTEEDKLICNAIFNSVGTISEVPEKLMDAVTGLSGSGPAYVFMFIEALADGGVRAGLPRNIALQLAAQTVRGAATMCLESGLHPGVLKDQVCSPGGTTIAAVQSLEEHGFRAAAISAVVAATERSIELREKSK
mmetsp:Transcript_18324/g.19092  ORF Transcript_18324/g.19092 Transcript_18324/m.19092 type:complete len:285 (+) Transcript_18324:11-865(+)